MCQWGPELLRTDKRIHTQPRIIVRMSFRRTLAARCALSPGFAARSPLFCQKKHKKTKQKNPHQFLARQTVCLLTSSCCQMISTFRFKFEEDAFIHVVLVFCSSEEIRGKRGLEAPVGIANPKSRRQLNCGCTVCT